MYRSFLINVPYYLLYFASFVGLLFFIIYYDKRDGDSNNDILSDQGILAVAIALSIAFGFFTLVCLLGYGLIKIPISYWQESSY